MLFKLLVFFCSFFTVLIFIAYVNYRIDPVGLFDDGRFAASAADALNRGEAIAIDNINDRLIIREYAYTSVREVDLLVLGSSRVMSISDDMIEEFDVFNAAVSSATLKDISAISELFLQQEHVPDVWIIGIDTWLLNGRQRNSRWRTLTSEYNAIAERLKLDESAGLGGFLPFPYNSLVELAVTKESILTLQSDGLSILFFEQARAVRVLDDEGGGTTAELPDGSIRYGGAYGSRNDAEVRASAIFDGRQLVTESLRGPGIAPSALDDFEKLVKHIRSLDKDVIFALIPFHPDTYRYVKDQSGFNFLGNLEVEYRELAKRLDVKVLGGYDPSSLGCQRYEFFDGIHPKEGCIARIFDEMGGHIID
jgi:hypothetical protein